ncbi:DUF2716 domain-containing protein [Kibdelosporangium lantanae]|uniref:DUF2716 domain-containing protein n=1 Tax=Kibdelosporangium lantanae TaxID=1497396 RepID=A0ABW3MFB6_9PSEU
MTDVSEFGWSEFAWADLDWEPLGREMWHEFVADFGFRHGKVPALNEPAPSITWALPSPRAPHAQFPEAAQPVSQLVCDVLRECVEYWDSLVHHDGVHPSGRYRPHAVTDVADLERWEYSHYPNGDYMIFVSKDHTFGVLGDPFEASICFFGVPAVNAVVALNDGVLEEVLRRDGRSA